MLVFKSSLSQCQDHNTPVPNRNTSENKLEKEKTMRIAVNKKASN